MCQSTGASPKTIWPKTAEATEDKTEVDMIAAIYTALSALFIIRLSMKVIGIRHEKQVSLGDGDDAALKGAIAAQHNAVEYLPIAMLLLFMLESNGGPGWLLHGLGILMLAGRFVHANAMWTDDIPRRVLGMKLTIWALILLAVGNLGFSAMEYFGRL